MQLREFPTPLSLLETLYHDWMLDFVQQCFCAPIVTVDFSPYPHGTSHTLIFSVYDMSNQSGPPGTNLTWSGYITLFIY